LKDIKTVPTSELKGKERKVNAADRAAIDGAPIPMIVGLAAIISVLAIVPIPISVVLGSGKNFPMSQSLYPLVGWLLGPVAGAVANGIGALVGVFVAPYTSSNAVATVFGATLGGLAAGSMVGKRSRRRWWIPLSVVFVVLYALYGGRAVVVNGAPLVHVLLGSFIDWSALLLYLLPTRALFGRLIGASDHRQVSLGLFLGTWCIAGLVHLSTGAIVYYLINWPGEVWLAISPLAPIEHIVRCVVGSAIGLGVISGLRAMNIQRPPHALY